MTDADVRGLRIGARSRALDASAIGSVPPRLAAKNPRNSLRACLPIQHDCGMDPGPADRFGGLPPRPDRGEPVGPTVHSAVPGAAVVVSGLTKRFGGTVAVNALDLQIPRGTFFGLVGPNGAGKTTTLRMVTGLLRPDAGQAWVDGVEVWRDPVAAKAQMGVVPEDLRLFERLTGMELLTYNGLLRGMDPSTTGERAGELLRVLALANAGGTLVVDYSHGMRKKIALAAALLHAPKVLFLDEPLEAVDPLSARTIRTVLERDVEAGATVLFSSHVMELVERLCDRVAILHQGRLVADGPLAEVKGEGSLEDAFVRLVGAEFMEPETLRWLGTSSA